MEQRGLAPLLGVIIVLVIIIVAGGAFFLGKNSQSNSETETHQTSPATQTTTQSPASDEAQSSIPNSSSKVAMSSPSSTPDPTANWKSYSSQKYGYSVKYPTGLQSNEVNTSYDHYVEFTSGRDSSGNAYLPDYTVTVTKEDFQAKDPVSVNFMSADWISNFYSMNTGDTKSSNTVTFKKLENEKLVGQTAIVIEVSATGDNQKRYFLKKNGYVYMISNMSNSSDFKLFLSSFKFTN